MLFRRMRAMKAWSVLVGLSALSAVSQAAVQTLDGQYLQISYDDAALPAGFGKVQLRESALNWSCSDVSCALTGPMSAAVVFGTPDGLPVGVTSQALNFSVSVIPKTVDGIVDPLGHQWGLVSADLGKWTIGVDIASQLPQPGDPQFASAYGQFSYSARGLGVLPSWSPDVYVRKGSRVTQSSVLGLHQIGEVGVGAGATGNTNLGADGRVDPLNNFDSFDWAFATQLDGARWAYPSTTDVLCSSPSCMEYKTATVGVNDYFLSFNLVATTAAVPEPGSMGLMLLGCAGLVGVMRRRMVSANA